MPASSNLIGNMTTVITAGPSATTKANSIAYGGPIMDYAGMCNLVLSKLQAVVELIGLSGIPKGLVTVTDSSGDATNLAALTAVSHALTGGGAPSTALITAMKAVISRGPQGVTATNALANTGPVMDYIGNTNLVLLKLQECLELLSPNNIPDGIISVTASSDDSSNLTYLQNVALALS